MAQVQYDEGVPDVLPRESVPDDYQHIQANPAEFGGLIAQGAEKAGQGVLGAAKFFGEVAADNASNEFQDRATKILHGDPNKQTIGPDGQPTQDLGYLGLKGRAALDARPGVESQFDNLTKELRGGLTTPNQQLQFDNFTRRYRNYLSGEIGTHADQQANTWYGQVNSSTANLALTHIAQNPDNPELVAHNASDLINARVKQIELSGGSDEQRQVAVNEAKAEALAAQTQSIAIKDPARALKILDQNKNIASVVDAKSGATFYDQLASRFRARAEQQNGITAASGAVNDAVRSYQPAPLPKLQDAIYGQESGHGANTRTSPTGAVGGMQIEPATFRQFANPGENINNPADNKAVGDRIIANYYQQYNGDPYRVAVAYFSGPGNVSPPGSATPWLQDRNDGHTSVSQYVSQVAGRLGYQPQEAGVMPHAPLPGNDPYALHAAAMKRIMSDPDLNENEKQHAFQFLNRSFTQAQVAAEADVKAKKTANDNAANDYVSTFMKSGATPQMLTAIANDPNLNWETKENLQKVATSEFGLESTTQFGKAYADTYKRIFVAPDDPTRINDINDILKLGIPGQDNGLTPRGVQELGRVFQASRKNPDQASVNQTKSSLLQYGKSLLSFDQEMLYPGIPPMKDQKGVQAFDATFVPQWEAATDRWVKAQKDPWDPSPSNPFSKDYIDKLAQRIRPKAQMAMDRIKSGDAATGEKTEQAVPPKPQAMDDATWQEIMQHRPLSPTGRPVSPTNWWGALRTLQQNPTQENINYFNKEFTDVDGAALLKKIQPVPAAQDKDYDYAGAKAASVKPDERGHLPDTYKLPNHITFSDESKYNDAAHQGGHWKHIEGQHWEFTPGPENFKHHTIPEMQAYFRQYEPESKLIIPPGAGTIEGTTPVSERGATWLPQTLLPPELRRNPPPVEKPPPQYDEHMNPPTLGIRG